MFNQSVLHGEDLNWRVPVAAGFAAMTFAFLEKGNQKLVMGVTWIALVTVLLARTDPKVPSPTETLLKYWNQK